MASVMLILLAVGMSAAAYTFLSQSQETVIGETRRAELETVNLTCAPERVTWWVNNTGDVPVSPTASLFVQGSGGINATLSRTGLDVEDRLRRAGGVGRVQVSPEKDMGLGEEYGLELAFQDTDLTSSCRVGGAWWDANWEYRRALELDTGSEVTAEVVLDAESLVDGGKLRSDCADLRGVKRQDVMPYRVTFCNPDGTARLRVNLSGARPGEAYIYYGNLQAEDGSEDSLQNEGIVNPDLGPEERVNLR